MEPESAGGLAMLGLNLNVFLAQLFNVLVVFFVLRQWAFKPLIGLLEARRARVEQADADAKEAARRVKDSQVEREAILQEARREAQVLREAAVADGDRVRHEATEHARAEAETIVHHGKAQLARDQEQMVREARGDMAKLAVDAAEKVLRGEVNRAKADALAKEVVTQIVS